MLIENTGGNYFFLPGGSPYSSAVVASPGYELIHVTFGEARPLVQAFDAIGVYLAKQGRPFPSLCALELRCPAPYSFAGFAEFNEEYRSLLKKHDLLGDGPNPIARTNVAPFHRPSEPVVHAFTYTAAAKAPAGGQTFVVSGAGELENSALDPQAIRRRGEQSAAAMADKARLVMDNMQARLNGLGTSWSQVTGINIYSIHNIHSFLESDILARVGSASRYGVRWYCAQPPVSDIEFEMDLHGIRADYQASI
jgi:enamine deaminase RidA (YjgF/YER057c/UK114 family)